MIEIDQIVQKEMKKRKIVGANLALVDASGIIFSKGYGFADKANNKSATAQTVYPFGSVTKVITMASVLKCCSWWRTKALPLNGTDAS